MSKLKEERARKKAEKILKHASFEELVKWADDCYEQGKFNEAVEYLTRAIKLNPKVAVIYNNRGVCYKESKKYGLALKDYNQAIELNPYDYNVYNRIAICHLDSNFEDSRTASLIAEKYLDISLHIQPNFDAYLYKGCCNLDLNHEIIALINFNRAIELCETNDTVYYFRGHCHFKLKNYILALIDFRKSIELNPNNVDNYTSVSMCYIFLEDYNRALDYLDKHINLSKNNTKKSCILASNISVKIKEYDKARNYINLAFKQVDSDELEHKNIYLDNINNAEELDRKNQELEETNKALQLQIQQTEIAQKAIREKEKEMISFFTHTMRNALATAPESLRQAIRLLGSDDYEKNQKHYEAINEITGLFSTISLTDCLIDTFKQSIYDTEEFKLAWQNDNTGDARPEWFIAAALRQSLNRIIFIEDTTGLRKLINNQGELIKPTRKAFIEQVLPLDINQHDIEKFYHWLQSMNALEVTVEKSSVQFGANKIKFSLMFAISSELILNALKYWNGTGKIQVRWFIDAEFYIFSVSNICKANASSQLAGTHKGLAFINRLIELLGEQAQFNCNANEQQFNAELKLHKTLLEG